MKNNEIIKTKEEHSFPDFIVLLFIILLLIIDFLPYFNCLEIINPQFLYLSILNIIIAIYFYFNSNLIPGDILAILRQTYITRLYFCFIFFCGLSFFTAKNVSLVFTKFTEILIIFCLFINLCILLKNKLNLLYKIAFIVSISAFIQSWQQLCHFIIIPRNVSILNLLNAMKGNTGNINILAASLTIKIPFLFLSITHFKKYKKWFLVIALFSAASIIFLTGARTALVNVFFTFSIFTIYLIREYSFTKQTLSKILHLFIPILIAILFSNLIFEKSKDNTRYVSLENRVGQINSQDESLKARFAFWNNVLKISQKNPLLGVGLGNYQIESIPYEKETANESGVSLHAHNDFLEILAETGIINALIYFSLFIVLLITNLKNILKSDDKKTEVIAMLTLMLLIVYGVDSFFNFPMYRPTMQIFFSLMLALSIINNCKIQEHQETRNKSLFKKFILVFFVVSILTTCSSYIIYKASNLEYLIATDDINTNEKGVLNGDEVVKRIQLYPNVFQSSESFYEYAAIYYLREKKYEKAFQCFYKAGKINPYLGRIDFYKHIIASQRGKADSAYIYSKKAFYTRPRNFDFYKSSINYASANKDTTEILKEHKLFTKYRNMPQAWDVAASSLQNAGYNYKNIITFINEGLRSIPKDSSLQAKKNNILITNYLIEGQNFESQLKLDKALESFKSALKIDPKNVYALQNIGFYFYKRGENKKALHYLLEAIKYPGLYDGKTEFFIGYCYLLENDKQNSCKYFYLSKAKNYTNPSMNMFVNCK